MPKTINEYFQPSSTGVHNNIDNLIIGAELDRFAQTGSIRADRTPEYIGGVDPVVENIAMGPLLTLKSLGSVGKKILEKTGLRNPVSHFTKGESAKDILESGIIKGASGAFPGRPFKKEMGTLILDDSKGVPWSHSPKSPAVSVTRDPMFSNRPHHYVGTDIRFVMDRDDLIKKGFKIEPFTELNYRKTIPSPYNSPNPRFEFEERVRGYVPTENIKLIDILQLPLGQSDVSEDMLKLLGQLSRANIPIIKSSLAKNRLSKIPVGKVDTFEDIYKLMETPTYKHNPFKVSDYYAF
jgi:hypothetical protein